MNNFKFSSADTMVDMRLLDITPHDDGLLYHLHTPNKYSTKHFRHGQMVLLRIGNDTLSVGEMGKVEYINVNERSPVANFTTPTTGTIQGTSLILLIDRIIPNLTLKGRTFRIDPYSLARQPKRQITGLFALMEKSDRANQLRSHIIDGQFGDSNWARLRHPQLRRGELTVSVKLYERFRYVFRKSPYI